ncbi:MAG: glycosyltransferase family 2 protein [Nitrospinae bacterium]|nr:glycosyltransferase family 2 protein [Nitrospinota bacterium]
MAKEFSLILPAYNEEQNLEKLLPELDGNRRDGFELIVVADGSTDNTARIAEKYADKVLCAKEKMGKGSALWRGFHASSCGLIAMMDADLSHSSKNLWEMVALLDSSESIGMVIGSRRLGGSEDHTVIREIGNKILTEAGNLFFKVKLTDMLNGYKAFRKDLVMDGRPARVQGFEIEVDLILRVLLHGKQIKEIPDREYARAHGKSNLNSFTDGTRILWRIIAGGLELSLKKQLNR